MDTKEKKRKEYLKKVKARLSNTSFAQTKSERNFPKVN